MLDQAQTVDRPSDFGTTEADVVSRWASEITLAKKAREKWHKQGKNIVKRYTDELGIGDDVQKRKFCLLWANVQTLAPAVFARTPTAVVGRRWKDNDPVGRLASEVVERAINFSLDAQDFENMMINVRDNFLLVASGQAWVRYVPHIVSRQTDGASAEAEGAAGSAPEAAGGSVEQGSAPSSDAAQTGPVEPPDGQVTDADSQYDEVLWEEAIIDHVHWTDFFTNPARTWAEVRWCGRRVFLDREELIARFGKERGTACPLDWKVSGTSTTDGKEDTQFDKAEVYEIWDRRSRKVFWINVSYTAGPLDQRDDPLKLKNFFPCPRPVLGTCGPDSIVPTPDYEYYASQAKEIDLLTRRIGLLTDALKVRGFYAATQTEKLEDLLAGETNTLVPIESWAALKGDGGLDGLISWLPLDQIVTALKTAMEVRKQMLDDVFQLTGIADIMRGDTDPDETLGAQQLKTNWGSSRVRDKQSELARFSRDLIRIVGEVVASRFSAETLSQMTGIKLFKTLQEKQAVQQQIAMQQQLAAQPPAPAQPGAPPAPRPAPPPVPEDVQRMLLDPTWAEVEQLLHDDALRSFRIDIETDSTIQPDDQEEKQRRVEFVEAVASYLEKTQPVVQLAPPMLPVVLEGLKFLVRGFRVGREMEDIIEQATDKLMAMAQNAPPPGPQQHGEPPQVQAMKAQASMTTAQAHQVSAQADMIRARNDVFKAQTGAQLDQQQIHAENIRSEADRQSDQSMHGQDLAADMRKAEMTALSRHFVHDINAPHLIEGQRP